MCIKTYSGFIYLIYLRFIPALSCTVWKLHTKICNMSRIVCLFSLRKFFNLTTWSNLKKMAGSIFRYWLFTNKTKISQFIDSLSTLSKSGYISPWLVTLLEWWSGVVVVVVVDPFKWNRPYQIFGWIWLRSWSGSGLAYCVGSDQDRIWIRWALQILNKGNCNIKIEILNNLVKLNINSITSHPVFSELSIA